MKVEFPRAAVENSLTVLRKAGYAYFTDPVTRESSYVMRLTGDFYPRWHLYVTEKPDKVIFDLHLDQKKPSYGSGAAHAGEYTGPMVEKELKRIESWVSAVLREERNKEPHKTQKPANTWADWFFGR